MGAESVYKAAAYQPVHYKSYAKIDPSFLKDLSSFVAEQTKSNRVDVAFVDSGVCIRGDLVQVLFNEVPIIVAHDVAPIERRLQHDVYGYGRVIAPTGYEEIYVSGGMGTAFWIKKDPKYAKLIDAMKKYALTATR
jgi:hypothetical protein